MKKYSLVSYGSIKKDAPMYYGVEEIGTLKLVAYSADYNAVLSAFRLLIMETPEVRLIEMKPDEQSKVDGPIYNAGRSEGHSDIAAKLREILDPEDIEHWNLDGLLAEVALANALANRAATEPQAVGDAWTDYDARRKNE